MLYVAMVLLRYFIDLSKEYTIWYDMMLLTRLML